MAHLLPGSNNLFAIRGNDSERRRYPRYAVKGRSLRVVFTWEVHGRRGTGRGVIRDMSQGGLCMLTGDRLPVATRLQVEFENVETSAQVSATVVYMRRARWLFFGPRVVGLRFLEECPYDLFAAAFGWRRSNAAKPAEPQGEQRASARPDPPARTGRPSPAGR